MHVHITGAASFIGKILAEYCRQTGIEISGSDLAACNIPNTVIADTRDKDFAKVIPYNTDCIVHLAALSREADCKGRIDEWYAINVAASLNVVRAAKERGVSQLIFASSEWVYDFGDERERHESDLIDPMGVTSEYGLSKLLAEVALRRTAEELDIALTILRFGIVYGERLENWSAVEALLSNVATMDKLTVGSLATARRFIHVSDIAKAIRTSFGRGGIEIFNIQGPALVTLDEVIRIAGSLTGKSPSVCESDPLSASIRCVNVDHADRELGWRARIDIAEGMRMIAPVIIGPTHE